MQMIPVPGSNNISLIGIEGDAMRLQFRNGSLYEYRGPKVAEHYQQLIRADISSGSYFAKNVRECKATVCRRINEDGTTHIKAGK